MTTNVRPAPLPAPPLDEKRFTIETAREAAVPAGGLPRIPARGQYTEAARIERLEWTAKETGAPLEALSATRLAAERLTGNVENLIGAVEVPVGIVGPLRFLGHRTRGLVYAPYATTEGALVASATRGATAISRAGGVTARVIRQRMMRVPVFELPTLTDALRFTNWIRDHGAELREQVAQVSRHASLVSVEPVVLGRQVHVHFTYETGDAAGQNMTTACTWHACQWLIAAVAREERLELESFLIEGNASGDKKVNYHSFVAGRGIRVVAEAHLDADTLRHTLKVTPEQLLHANAALLAGAVQAGMVGYNINVANTIAAIFAATGQDIACVHESSIAQLHLQPADGGVHATMILPALIIGTVGGGTHLPAQRALLEVMGCAGPGKVQRLAEIIAGFALALDLSTLSAIASGEFASAHERLGRNRPVRWFGRDDLTPSFFEDGMRAAAGDDALRVTAVEDRAATLGSSILTELTGRRISKLAGFVPLRISHTSEGRGDACTDVLVKAKPLDVEILLMIGSMATMCGSRLGAAFGRFRDRTPFVGTHLRELGVYEQRDPRFTRHVPRVYGIHRDKEREAYILVLEHLQNATILDAADHPDRWTPASVATAVRGIGEVHGIWLGRESELLWNPWLGRVITAQDMAEMSELFEALAQHGAEEFPELIPPAHLALQRRLIAGAGEWWARLERMPRTLIHNDFNPRNVAIRGVAGEPVLCAYDWELATMHVPQRDLAEFLCFVLSPLATDDEVEHWLRVHREAVERSAGVALDAARWREGYALSLRELAIDRVPMYLMAHTFRQYAFLPRVIATLRHLLAIEGDA